jgi:hypothetical protein
MMDDVGDDLEAKVVILGDSGVGTTEEGSSPPYSWLCDQMLLHSPSISLDTGLQSS